MKVFAISDLHLSINNPKPMDIFGPVWDNYVDDIIADWKAKVTEEDVVLLAGDLSWAMKLSEAEADIEVISELPGKKIIIRGNHDFWWESIKNVRSRLGENMFALQNDAIKIGNCVFAGTRGWMVPNGPYAEGTHNKKIFDREYLRLEMCLNAAKKLQKEGDKLICMIHYPPFNNKKENSTYTELIEKFGVDIVVYGHLHAIKTFELAFVKNGVKYYLTSCDLLENKLTEVK